VTSWPWALKDEAQAEAYEYFDRCIRKLPKSPDGKIDSTASGFQDNDVDAFRHAYVSGVFTQEYSEAAADVFGRMNEFFLPDLYSNSRNPRALNMDLWNNSIGRKYGKATKDRKELLKKVYEALKRSDLIVDPHDLREYQGVRSNPENNSKSVIVLTEDAAGRNEIFFDLVKKAMLTRADFVAQIQAGGYPSYSVKNINGILTPVSNADSRNTNNLG
jgi:hypothetical protein